MKRHYIIVFLASLIISVSGTALNAQETIPEGYELVDSVVYRPVAAVDTTLVGKDVFLLMPSREMGAKAGVKITQTDMVASAMRRQVADNGERTLSGYRVRIYANPYFKVTVGDFRTRSEAVRLLERIKGSFPSAFVVKENIEFPVVDKDNAYVVDTVKVLRPKPVSY